jgi:hypothetical protein
MVFDGTEVEIIWITGSRGQGSREVEVMAIWRLLEVKHKVLWRLQRLLEGKAQVRRRSLKVEVNELWRLLEIDIKVI